MMSWLTQSSYHGFYGCKVIKSVVTLVSGTSVISLFAYKELLERSPTIIRVLEHVVQVWALPSPGLWMTGALLLYACRPVERRLSSYKMTHMLISSSLIAVAAYISIALTRRVSAVPPQGFAVYCLLSFLLTQLLLNVTSPHAFTVFGVRVSSHIVTVLLTIAVCATFPAALLSFCCGLAGTCIVHLLGPLPLPSAIIRAVLRIADIFGKEEKPKLLSGATLAVQQQQRTDQLEAMVASFQRPVQFPVIARRGSQYTPSPAEIQILTGMGFRPQQATQALNLTNGNLQAAVQLLTT